MPDSLPNSVCSLLDSLAVGVVLTDADWMILHANATARNLLGLTLRPAAPERQPPPERVADRLRSGDEIVADLRLKLRHGARASARAVECVPLDRGISVDLAAEEHNGSIVLTLTDAAARLAAENEAARLRERLSESEAARAKLSSLQAQLVQTDDQPVMVGGSTGLQRVRAQVSRVAPTDTTVLVQGETGSGKELVARLVHAESPRARNAFVAVNCAALPESLVESELFGHERGAFTGADRRKLGKFELADGGTIFLDELAELPLAAQAKLLRVLQGGTFERVGGSETIKVDARVIAATHRDLARRVERGLFREDLFYRLNVFRIEVPPLRDRREDLRELVEHLHRGVAKKLARPVLPLSDRSLRRIMAYRWPGNIRELSNAVERSTLLADGAELEIELPEGLPPGGAGSNGGGGSGGANGAGARGRADAPSQPRDVLLDLSMEQLQRLHIMHVLESCDYQVFGSLGAADKLDINPNTLLSRMDKYGIPRPRSMRKPKK